MNSSGPLAGYRVIELGQLLAGPFAGCMLGYFGAEVIKIESPDGGDPIRRWREMRGDTSLWWRSLARNKKSVTIDLKTEKGVELVRRLIAQADVVIENFRPGVVEKWGLGPEDFRSSNPGLVYARISGYGQDGPYASKPGFASVCEGMSGFRYVNGQPGEAPVRPNPGGRRGAGRVDVQPDGGRGTRVRRQRGDSRAFGKHGNRDRADQYLSLC
jgi:crotonobetainyl-CoA:carnitine CoA-transferase CaiB-like acyl-CoA transferase